MTRPASARRPAGTAALLLLALALAGCGGDGGDAGAPAEDPTPSEAMPTPAAEDARVPMDPTGEDQLPPAIVGEGGELMGSDLRYISGDTLTTGYLAVPAGEGPFPALVIIHEWNGLVDRVRHVADDLAAEGYVTLAVDLYDGRTGSDREENMALVQEVRGDEAKMLANMNAAVAYLRQRDDVTGRVGAMGWCFGGGIALSFGLGGAQHEATGIFYGQLLTDPAELEAMDHEVYGTFAELDEGIPPEQVEEFVQALDAAGIGHDVHVYDDVNHGFWLRVDEDPEARREPALDAWQRLKAYLGRTLGSQG